MQFPPSAAACPPRRLGLGLSNASLVSWYGEDLVTIRTFRPGDEIAQVGIYNEVGADLPKFKPATIDELRRRNRAADFEASARFFALEGNTPVAYAGYHPNGRVSYPWCRKGHEHHALPLLQTVLDTMRQRGLSKAFVAYRGDWSAQLEFFHKHGFSKTREMVNFMLGMAEMPTPAVRRHSTISSVTPEDLPAILTLAGGALRSTTAAELGAHLFQNPYFAPNSLFALRESDAGTLMALAIAIYAPGYADPRQVDSAMPCFRLGAFGSEGTQVKRINGLFSFLAKPADAGRLGIDLLSHAAHLLRDTPIDTFAAQVPSDVPHLLRFYEHHFRKQASFPILERPL
jgi:hypothetical protein